MQGGPITPTLLAYAAADLNTTAAAKDLLIHVNIVHRRLSRSAEKSGRDLHRVPSVIDLLIAIRLTDGSSR